MTIAPELVAGMADRALDQMIETASTLTPEQLNTRPHGRGTNSVAALIHHCCEMSEFWLGHVALGRPSERDRDTEFGHEADLASLRAEVEAAKTRIRADLAATAATTTPNHEARVFLTDPTDDDAFSAKIIEELFQHLGHIELTADALRS